MTRFQKILVGVAVAVVLVAVVSFSVLSKSKAKGVEVYIAKAARKDVVAAVTATGRIQPRTKVNIQSSVIGQIVKLPVKEGDPVKTGDLLVQIDPRPYQAEVDRLEANLRMGRIAVEQQEVALENQHRTLARNQALYKDSLIAPQVLEQSQLDVKSGEINLKSLKEQISQAIASLDKARDELRKTTIVSPMDGLVTQLNAEVGEMTLTGTMNNPGTVIMVVSDMGEVLAEVDVDETRVVQVSPGESARVVVDAIGETKPYEGKVTEIGGTATVRTGQQVQIFPVKIALSHPDPNLRPGMTAKARIESKRADKAITVPIQTVQLRPESEVAKVLAEQAKGGGARAAKKGTAEGKASGTKGGGTASAAALAATSDPARADAGGAEKAAGLAGGDKREIVFKVVDGKATVVPVKTGISDETDVVILDGLKEGDTVVTGPYRAVKKLKDGEAVKESTGKEKETSEEGGEESSSSSK